MKAVTFDPDTNRFRLQEIPIPEPGPDEVRVKVIASSINPVDAKITGWKRAVEDMKDSWVTGVDVSGIIDKTGDSVKGWAVGDRVLYHGNMFKDHGGFAEYAVHRAATLVKHPDTVPQVAAATPCAGWTAYRALVDKLRIDESSTLLIGGGAGSVGSFAVQIARSLGVKTIIATCSDHNSAYVKGLGATHTIDYHHEDIVNRVLEITGGIGVTHAFDTIGNGSEIPIANSLAFEGEMVEIVSLVRPELYDDSFGKGLTFHQLALGSAHSSPRTEPLLTRTGKAFNRLLEQGEIRVEKMKDISLEEAPGELEGFLKNPSPEKIIIVPEWL